jgi:hypothetical protein
MKILVEQFNTNLNNKNKNVGLKNKTPTEGSGSHLGSIMQQASRFNCTKTEYNVNNKMQRYKRGCGTISRTLKRRKRKETKLEFYIVATAPTLLHGRET